MKTNGGTSETRSGCLRSSNETTTHRVGQLLAGADRKADSKSGIDKVDPIVAAVSDIHGEPVRTDNVGDFTALGVGVETYSY